MSARPKRFSDSDSPPESTTPETTRAGNVRGRVTEPDPGATSAAVIETQTGDTVAAHQLAAPPPSAGAQALSFAQVTAEQSRMAEELRSQCVQLEQAVEREKQTTRQLRNELRKLEEACEARQLADGLQEICTEIFRRLAASRGNLPELLPTLRSNHATMRELMNRLPPAPK